jgi:hypothetical protein
VVVHALVDCFKRFGVAETHVSDKGSHFKNKVVAELDDILKTKHHFTTAYSSKSNGTVERVNREIMKVLRSLVSQFKINWNEWARLLPLVQNALNNYKSPTLAGQAHITVFTGLPAYSPLAVVLQGSDAISFNQSKMKSDEAHALVTDLKESLEELHRKVETSTAAERARSRRKSEKYVKANFDVGDYVLVRTTQFGMQAETPPPWIGPFRVVAALSQWVFAVEHISTKKREVHANALRFYHDPSLNVELSVEEQLAFDEVRVYEVEEIEDLKKRGEKWMLRVKWNNYDEKT